jgi:internalin A
LATLPDTLQRLRALQEIYLHGNDQLGIPHEILGPTWEQMRNRGATPAEAKRILKYYFLAQGGSWPLNEAKLILIGRGEVGKTCLVNRLVRDVFADTSKTQGISITQWPIRLHGAEEVRLNVWDFGGQEIMHATHQFFLTRRSLYLLVLNGRQGDEDAEAEYWLQLTESFGGDSPVIVVLNKIQEHPFDLNRRALQAKYPAIREFIRVDCKERTGIDELHAAIHRATEALQDLRVPFPASWVAIKDRLAGMAEQGDNYIDFERYRTLCATLGETDPEAQEALAGYLHSLGIALNFKDDPRLHDTHVLSPHWVTNGIYKILNWPELEKQQGVLRPDELVAVLDAQAYPKTKHAFLLDLMKKFEVCFEFPDDPQRRYLVPELLDKQEPVVTDEFDPVECLNFQYHYNILPAGLLPRFIVRTHLLSAGQARWRTGVVLEFEGNRALVKVDMRDRQTHIYVTGPVRRRRRRLGVIGSRGGRIPAEIN